MNKITLYLSGYKNTYSFSLYEKDREFDNLSGVYIFLLKDGEYFSKIFIGETESFKNKINLTIVQDSKYKYTHIALLEEKKQQKRFDIITDLKAKYFFLCDNDEEISKIVTSDSRQFRMDSL